MLISLLDANDKDQVEQVLISRNEICGVPRDLQAKTFALSTVTTEIERFSEYYLNEHRKKNAMAFGVFNEEKELCYIIGAIYSSNTNSWFWSRFLGKRGRINRKMVKSLFNYVSDFSIQRGFLKWYAVYPIKWASAYHRLVQAVTYYDVYLDTVVPAKTKPPFADYWLMLENQLWDVDMGVYLYILKEEYRHEL